MAEEHAEALNDEGRALLERIGVSAERLDHLIRDVLDYSKVLRGEVTIAAVDMQGLIEEIIQGYPNLRPEAAEVTISGALPTVLGNRAALTQVFANLLGNAAKFVQPGMRPEIRVHGEDAGEWRVRLWVEDKGIGIEPGEIPKLFQMFHRAHSRSQYEGTGMGLAIVRKAVERMNGQVGAESVPGKGSRFWVELRSASSGKTN